MKLARIMSRLALLCALLLGISVITFAVARAAFPSLMASSVWSGSLSGRLNGTINTNQPFTVTARGVTSTTNYYSVTLVTRQQPNYTFTRVESVVGGYTSLSGIRPGTNAGGYDQPQYPSITWTLQVSSPLSCYSITPGAIITSMTSTQTSMSGLNFTAQYVSTPATITARLGSFLPLTPTNTSWFKAQYQIRRSDGITTLSQMTPYGTPVTFTNLLNTAPADGSCGWTYTVTLYAAQIYSRTVAWRTSPQSVVVSVDNRTTTGSATLQPYLYRVYQPFVTKH
jgi:hypothetical protein